MSDDLRWPVLVTRSEEYILWAPGDAADDAVARLRRRDPIVLLEETDRSDDCVGGGVTAEILPDWYDPYEYNEQYGPRLPDGSFWGPGALAHWKTARATRAGGEAA